MDKNLLTFVGDKETTVNLKRSNSANKIFIPIKYIPYRKWKYDIWITFDDLEPVTFSVKAGPAT